MAVDMRNAAHAKKAARACMCRLPVAKPESDTYALESCPFSPRVSSARKLPAIEKPYSTRQLASDLATETGIPQGKIKAVFARLETLMAGHMKHKQPFSLLGLLKMQVVTKPATKARKGTHPLTGKPMTIPAKPA